MLGEFADRVAAISKAPLDRGNGRLAGDHAFEPRRIGWGDAHTRSSESDRSGMIVARTPGIRKCSRVGDTPAHTADGLHCAPRSPAVQSIFCQLRCKSLQARLLLRCIAPLRTVLDSVRGQCPGVWTMLSRPKMRASRRFRSNMSRRILSLFILVLAAAPARAGLHSSGETPAELPSQWRGLLMDHRALRLIGVTPAAGAPIHLLREQYADAAGKLEEA